MSPGVGGWCGDPVINVEDISMVQMRLDNGVVASYQQCPFTPDYWRNYMIIGDAGRIENSGLRMTPPAEVP